MNNEVNDLSKWDDSHISIVHSFDSMRRFLENYWVLGDKRSEDIAMLLSSINRDELNNSYPVDRALWEDWLAAVDGHVQ